MYQPEIPTKIVLPKNQGIRTTLEKKAEEYRGTLTLIAQGELVIPTSLFSYLCGLEQQKIVVQSTGYKISLIESLLRNREVDVQALERELRSQDEQFDAKEYSNAVKVIDDYCTNGGKNVRGGTGFPLG